MALLGSLLLAFPVPVRNSLARSKLAAASPVPVRVKKSLARAMLETESRADTPNRSSFPDDFKFGTAGASYQYEGAAKEGGRGPSIWDVFTHKYPEKISDRSNGDVAVDFYNRHKGDVKLMKEMGMNAFRFSISWSRILPRGSRKGGVNTEGLQFYSDLIDELRANGLEPFVTLFHWDAPYALEDEYGGFLSPNIVDDFRDYANLCFEKFGDRVKHWITLNEPHIFSSTGFDAGTHAPGRCSSWVSETCEAGNSGTEPYVVSHHLILAHAAAVKVYKENYQEVQKGDIGITLSCRWMEPYSDDSDDKEAAKRALDFVLGWFMDPITFGDYPVTMRTLVRDRLPKFTEEQSEMVKGSLDFVGINYYTANYAANLSVCNTENMRYKTDSCVDLTTDRNGIPIGPLYTSTWVRSYPQGLRKLLKYTKEKYNDPIIYITENGLDEPNDSSLTVTEALKDDARIEYHEQHLSSLQSAINDDGVKVKGYFAWALVDNFEWTSGYTSRFGINFVDYKDKLKRYKKDSFTWFKNFLNEQLDPLP